MGKNKNLRFYRFALCILALTIIGCGQKVKTGKYTVEQMEQFGLAQTDNLPEPSGDIVLSIDGEPLRADEIVLPIMPTPWDLSGMTTDMSLTRRLPRPFG